MSREVGVKMKITKWASAAMLTAGLMIPTTANAKEEKEQSGFAERLYGFEAIDEEIIASSTLFRFDSGLTFEYPDAVRGVYVTGHSAGGERFNYLLDLMDTTDLNAMVIDIKDDFGNITYKPADDSPLKALDIGKPYIKDPQTMLKTLEEKKI